MYYYPNNNNNYPINQNFYQTSNIIKGRPVTSLDEVRAAQIDFDGSLFIFPDVANEKIYTKQINLDGTATINIYELSKKSVATNTNTEYVTKEELQKVIEQFNTLFKESQPSKDIQQPVTFNF